MKRRKNQPDIKHLSHTSRFLSIVAVHNGLTQAELSKKMGNVSTATISRWFRGDLTPTEVDRGRLAGLLAVPKETLTALAIFDQSRMKENMLPSAGTFGYLARGDSKIILLGGLTMIAGVPQLREVNFNNKFVLLDLLNPLSQAGDQFSSSLGINPSDLLYSWAASLSIITTMLSRSKGGHVRLWIRDTLEIIPERKIGQLAGNEWVVLEAGLPHLTPSTHYRIQNDEEWQEYLGAYIDMLKSNDEDKNNKSGLARKLIWDSAWTKPDARLIYFESEWLPKLHEKLASSRITLPQDR